MHWADITNGGFEISGSIFVLFSVIKTLKEKSSKGVSWVTVAYFMSWGFWNLYYYPSLDQWVSFVGGIGVVTMNTIWVVALIIYRRQ